MLTDTVATESATVPRARWERAAHLSPALRKIERRAARAAEELRDATKLRTRAMRRALRERVEDARDVRDSAALYVRRHPGRATAYTAGVMFVVGALIGWRLGARTRR